MSTYRENRDEFHAECFRECCGFVIEDRACPCFDLGYLRAREGNIVRGHASAQILLRNTGTSSAANVAKTCADYVSRRLRFFALQNVPERHIDGIIFSALKGACGAHFKAFQTFSHAIQHTS